MSFPQTITAPVGVIHVETVLGPARIWGIEFNSNDPNVPQDLIQFSGTTLKIEGVEKNPSEVLTWLGQEFPNGSFLMATVVLLDPHHSFIRCPSADFSFTPAKE